MGFISDSGSNANPPNPLPEYPGPDCSACANLR